MALAILMVGLSACTLHPRRGHNPFAIEYQGYGWAFEHTKRKKRIDCDVPPGKVKPGPYPYVFHLPRRGKYYLVVSLVVFSTNPNKVNQVQLVVDKTVVYTYKVGGPSNPGERIEIMPENPAIFKIGVLDAGTHALSFPSTIPEARYVIHWGVANEKALQAFWKRREPWLERPL